MTVLEREAFQDGFQILLLGLCYDLHQKELLYDARLFNGGRLIEHTQEQILIDLQRTNESIANLRTVLRKIFPQPHVLAVYGRNWQLFLDQCLVQQHPRLLDLRKAAVLLKGLSLHLPIEELLQNFAVSECIKNDMIEADAHEALLWGVLAQPNAEIRCWSDLLNLNSKLHPTMESYSFDREQLEQLPENPAVYIMYDKHDKVLYVGKAAVLRRRFNDYFRGQVKSSDKIDTIRRRIYRFDYELVGSELEALLLENRLIGELQPELNRQRMVHSEVKEGSYNADAIAIFTPSDVKEQLDVFFLNQKHALQLEINPRRIPRKFLKQLLDFVLCPGHHPKPNHSGLKTWPASGRAICWRYWQRFRHDLTWLNLNSGVDSRPLVEQLAKIAKLPQVALDTAEFRMQ